MYRNERSAAPPQTMCRELLSIRPSNLVTAFSLFGVAERAAHGLLSWQPKKTTTKETQVTRMFRQSFIAYLLHTTRCRGTCVANIQ